ncbi:response regulator [Desulfovibrio mangrovi]|uniref:response regulator n=1 Tax=Desulfovibrio mangrovi TaxID=2976983 RepID=UPI00224528C9|nr:response regulator [Desulfovibrio mangrovi]UZP66051.1 response regulator [Desulfovibrio mangrovi]
MPAEQAEPRILIADDSLSARDFLKSQLTALRPRIYEAENGVDALEIACSKYLDLIITDVQMPGMDGLSLCRKLKDDPTTQGVPIIILSNLESDQDITKGFDVGAVCYLAKSECKSELLQRVERTLERAALLRGKGVLVVDDSNSIRSVVCRSLAQAGFRVVEAENGREALSRLSSFQPDLILSDIAMPVMDGQTFCKAVRAMELYQSIPFVAMSSSSDRRMLRQMSEKGADAYLVKPFNVEEVVLLAEKLLSDHGMMLLQERSRLTRERTMLLSAIASLIQALEARDAYTRGHSESVASISKSLAEHMGLPPDNVERIVLAARLHDIGKIGIADSVLLKEGKLSDEEYDNIRSHPLKGAQILKPIPSMQSILDAVMYHHERMDGSGYPLGLKGSSIPLDARIVAVADVYDALTSNRPYRRAMSYEEASVVIKEMRGGHLCPDCVDAFMTMMKDSDVGGSNGQKRQRNGKRQVQNAQ